MSNDIQLDEWFKQQAIVSSNINDFPSQNAERCINQYNSISMYLVKIHEEVEKAAMLADGGGYLTDHGPEHIKRVIQRASDLVFGLKLEITVYEAYLLLMAIQLHDVGNGLGRKGHERQSGAVVNMLGAKMGDNHAENRLIQKIAMAHGGHVGDDPDNKDTLDLLSKFEPCGDKRVMMQLLAAILRFADELADDNSRASRYAHFFQMLPSSSEIFHEYARSLHTVLVNSEDKRIELGFEMTPADAKRKWGKLNDKFYLLDEIYERTWKMYRECKYCMDYMRSSKPNMRVIDSIKVKVEVLSNANKSVYTPMGSGGIEVIEYTIQEKGYPPRSARMLADFIRDLTPRDGATLRKVILDEEREQRQQKGKL